MAKLSREINAQRDGSFYFVHVDINLVSHLNCLWGPREHTELMKIM
jgi:hypothetical protein